DGRVPVFVGAGAESLGAARELARYAERAGASCVVLPAPQAGAVGEDALVEYFARVASEVSIPVMIQDAPAYLGVALGPGVVARAGRAAENIRLVKLEAGPAEMGHWLETLGADFAVWGGDAGVYLLDCVRTGAAGIIPGADLVDLLVDVYEADAGGEPVRADELFRRVLPMLVFQIQHSIDHYNACAKHVLIRRGIRTVARETVQTLALLGLVRVQHGKRTEVLPSEEWDVLSAIVQGALRREGKAAEFVRDVYSFRLLIEPEAAALMAADGDAAALAELDRLASAMEESAGGANGDAVMAADRDFHNLVARASGNRIIAAVSRDIREILRTLWELSRPDPEEQKQMAQQHRRIEDAIA